MLVATEAALLSFAVVTTAQRRIADVLTACGSAVKQFTITSGARQSLWCSPSITITDFMQHSVLTAQDELQRIHFRQRFGD